MSVLKHRLNRRRFFKTSATVAAGVSLPAWFVEESRNYAAAPRALSANDRPGIALVGCGGQGRGDFSWARQYGEVIAVCDLDLIEQPLSPEQSGSTGAITTWRIFSNACVLGRRRFAMPKSGTDRSQWLILE